MIVMCVGYCYIAYTVIQVQVYAFHVCWLLLHSIYSDTGTGICTTLFYPLHCYCISVWDMSMYIYTATCVVYTVVHSQVII